MLQLLREVEAISGCRDRDMLAASVVATVHDVFRPQAVRLLRLLKGATDTVVIVAQADHEGVKVNDNEVEDERALAEFPLLASALASKVPVWSGGESDPTRSAVFPIPDADTGSPMFLEIDAFTAPQAEPREALERFVRIYTNYIGLLDYSERDTLTGLLNRKTFDDSFDRLLSHVPPATTLPDAERRQDLPTADPRWIGVVDIDHFKRVNDTYGHLFGDEVLLRVANLLKTSFRRSDRLFRFGGEEFVIMLQPTPSEHAAMVFDRFREAVEGHDFPQVGKVTCSLGFTQVNPTLAPTDILGRADQALYYAKEHGRNQTLDFDQLVSAGLIENKVVEAAQPDFDIDALFD